MLLVQFKFLKILAYSSTVQTTIESVLFFIRDNSFLIGSVITVLTGLLWMKNLLREKRAEAFFGFYANLRFHIILLRSKLDEKRYLGTCVGANANSGNIFSALYDENLRQEYCPGYHDPEQWYLSNLKEISGRLKQVITESNCNVYPKNIDSKRWYDSQFIIFSFCDYIDNIDKLKQTYGKHPANYKKPMHIMKCEELVEAMDFIIQSLDKIKY